MNTKNPKETNARFPEILHEVEQLNNVSDDLQQQVENLCTRLAAVVRVEPSDILDEKETQSSTSLGQRLQSSRIRISDSVSRISDLLRLLEL